MNEEKCPSCGVTWKEENTIYQHFLEKGNTPEEASKAAKMYGCTKENPKCFSINVVGIEIQGKYDGVSYWECQCCKTVFDRWTMKPCDGGMKC